MRKKRVSVLYRERAKERESVWERECVCVKEWEWEII